MGYVLQYALMFIKLHTVIIQHVLTFVKNYYIRVNINMSTTTTLKVSLEGLIKYQTATKRSNLTTVDLYYTREEIIWTLPPQATLGSTTVAAIWIDGKKYTGELAWIQSWFRAVNLNRDQGVTVTKGRPGSVTEVNIATDTGARLTTTATVPSSTNTVLGAAATVEIFAAPAAAIQGPQGAIGPTGATGAQGPSGNTIYDLAVVDGNLMVYLTDGSEVNAGPVDTSLTVGSISLGPVPDVTIVGSAPSQVVDFVLPNSQALGLGNVTNESKATMFTNPALTGAVTVTGNVTVTGTLTVAGADPINQKRALAIGLFLK
jgi:hypothetical protein